MKKAEEERQKLEQKQRDEVAAAAAIITAQRNTPAEVSSLQTDGHRSQQQLPAVNNMPSVAQPYIAPPSDHVIPPGGGVSPVVDRSNKPAHLIQQESYPPVHKSVQEITPQPIVDRSTKPTLHHLNIADVYLRGIGQCYCGLLYAYMAIPCWHSVSYWLIV